MTQPSAGTRLAARPRVSATLFILCGLVVIFWLRGDAPWWLALIAVIAAGRTRGARREVQQYESWRSTWDAIGTEEGAAPAAPSPARSGRGPVIIAVAFVLGVPMALPHGATPPEWVAWLWGFACMFLLFKLLRRVVRRPAGVAVHQPAKAAKAEIADDAPVTWTLPRAASSPSRADASQRLPGYCAPLLAAEERGTEAKATSGNVFVFPSRVQ